KTGGSFDITAGPLINLWRIDPPDGYVPTADEIKAAQAYIDYKNIVIDEKNQTIMLKEKGMEANLGAIAKGYIADQVKEFLLEKGVEHGIINLGGNVLLIGSKNGTEDFRIGVQDPDSDRGAYLGVVSVKDCTVVSSGDYERYFTSNGKKYHHILDPFTGYPADTGLRQTTIITPKSVDGDGLSTSTFLLGADKAIQLIESMPDAEAIFVTSDHKIYVTSGLKDVFEFDAANYDGTYEVIYK
ncbi:MAG: FAD:protein FMN transferase, partial [Eubacteriaceae bacterium]|nr:FAD:protein FMN transferase [Eubacteriaceae bacterium]